MEGTDTSDSKGGASDGFSSHSHVVALALAFGLCRGLQYKPYNISLLYHI